MAVFAYGIQRIITVSSASTNKRRRLYMNYNSYEDTYKTGLHHYWSVGLFVLHHHGMQVVLSDNLGSVFLSKGRRNS